jgi:cell cycle checkpoint protein
VCVYPSTISSGGDISGSNLLKRMLVLHGPAGSGKTTTLSLLSQVLRFDIVEWKNPSGSEQSTQGYTSLSTQFDDFLGRSNIFSGLDLDDSVGLDTSAQSSQSSPMRRVILIEEFPSTLTRTSSALSAFRSSLRRCLAVTMSSQQTASFEEEYSADMAPPIVIIFSETLFSNAASTSDNFTIQRLLGPEICNHPGTTIIEFNPIAPTYMYKALDLVLRKEARDSMRKRIPSPAVLKRFSELGDIRSAISSLEFLCLRGDESGDWGGRIAAKLNLKMPSRDSVAMTLMERESLEMVTQREASLGLFHAVGKVVYNKREDPGSPQRDQTKNSALPKHLRPFERPRISQVSIEDLMNETGTDIQTFISALHENYVPSCDGPAFIDCLEGCIESLSDSDVLGSNSRGGLQGSRAGVGVARNRYQGYSASIDTLRNDEISFHVAVRGLLFSLPDPVRRRIGQSVSGSRMANAYKMYFPASLRLWKELEEMEGLVDMWERRLLDPVAAAKSVSGPISGQTGVKSWKSVEIEQDHFPGCENRDHSQATVVAMTSRDEILLHRLPYMAKIWSGTAEARELERITQFGGIRLPVDEIPGDEIDGFEPLSISHSAIDPDISVSGEQREQLWPQQTFSSFRPKPPPPPPPLVEETIEKLILSDDDIEDDN